jgi:hypothetical protein
MHHAPTPVRELPARQDETHPPLTAGALLVIAALSAVTLGQGGYYRRVEVVCGVLLVAAAAVWVAQRGVASVRPITWVVAGLAVVAATTVATGVLDGHPNDAIGALALLSGLGVVAIIVSGCDGPGRRQLVGILLTIGSVVAVTGWVGVAFRVQPFGHADGGLWRAATTVTYANAAGAVLAVMALWAMSLLVVHDDGLARVRTVVLVAGLGATLSRAGLGAFAAGVIVLGLLIGTRRMWRSIRRPLAGAAICVAALVPGMPARHAAQPLIAVVGLALGLAIGAAPAVAVSGRVRRAFGAALLLALVAAAVGAAHSHSWSGRVSASSPDRTSLRSVAFKEWKAHVWTGVGPGRAAFIWSTPDRGLLYDRYAHDEYLQTAVEEGVLGLLALAGLTAGVAVTARRGWLEGRSGPDGALRAGAIAGLVCFALHSGFDFLWHVPAVPLIAAVGVGLVAPFHISTPTTKEVRRAS